MTQHFSDRHGYRPAAAQITVREDAPPDLRAAIPLIARHAGMQPDAIRQVVCQVLLKQPDPSNWSPYPNVWNEVVSLVEDAPWYKVYDIAEALYAELAARRTWESGPADDFEKRLNGFFRGERNRLGTSRRPDHAQGLRHFCQDHTGSPATTGRDRPPTRRERNARSPEPDITGAIQHAMAALEATAREVTGQSNPTLGKLVPLLDLPAPLDQAVHKLWGYSSDRGRHIREQQVVGHDEAELIVTVAGSLCAFLAERQS